LTLGANCLVLTIHVCVKLTVIFPIAYLCQCKENEIFVFPILTADHGSFLHKKHFLKLDFHLSFWPQEWERERENDHMGVRILITLLFHRKVFLSVWSQEKPRQETRRNSFLHLSLEMNERKISSLIPKYRRDI